MLKGKNIILGVTGGIAAYKAAMIIRLLIKEGAQVKVIMTPLSREFITPLTLATLSKNPVLVDFFNPENGDWNSHVDLGIWADAFVVAPATANSMAKMATGVADNLLLTTYLSARAPVFIAPAMDLDMFNHPATKENIVILQKRGAQIIDAGTGELASGLEGKGRMAEADEIVDHLRDFFSKKKRSKLKGKQVLINAGPTFERLDPVRFIGNFSSGKMGIALADEACRLGANVILVLGPTHLRPVESAVEVISIESAEEMAVETENAFSDSDVCILAAAIADFTPKKIEKKKIKSADTNLEIKLKPTKDIAFTLGAVKSSEQVLVGFALETDNEEKNALQKLKRKNLDLIVLNSLNDEGAGFGVDTNRITTIDRSNNIDKFELKSKVLVAKDILKKVEDLLK